MSIIHKYEARASSINSLICVGLDSDYDRLPVQFHDEEHPQFAFNKWIIEQTHSYASAYKPNMAFYESRGTQGMQELKLTMDYIRANHPEIFTICDAKRGDIGSSNNGYVTSVFDWYGFDAVTLHPYLGREALMPFLGREDKGCIILCRTSNPGSSEFQDRRTKKGKRMWQVVAENVAEEWNENGNCMLVAGATYPEDLEVIRKTVGEMTLLIPGVGAQGGDVNKVTRVGLNNEGLGLIISASRSIIFAESPSQAAQELRDAVNNY
jgi:orotidine-5'-phosphate decarboxylase